MKAIYRCELCKKEFETFVTGVENAKLMLTELELEYSGWVRFKTAKPKCTHFCENGDLGLANFIGFKMEVGDEKESIE